MLKLKHAIAFFIVTALAVVARCYLVENYVDMHRGFYDPAGPITKIFDVAILIIGLLGAGFIYFSPAKSQTVSFNFSKNMRLVFALSSFLFGAFFVWNFIKNDHETIMFMPSGIVSKMSNWFGSGDFDMSKFMGNFQLYLGLVVGAIFVLQGLVLLANKRELLTSGMFKILQIIPVFWSFIEVMRIEWAYTTIWYISEHILELMALGFILVTLSVQASLLAFKTNSLGLVRKHTVSGLLAVFFSCLATIPFYISPRLTAFHESAFYYNISNLFIASAGLYILFFLICASFKNEADLSGDVDTPAKSETLIEGRIAAHPVSVEKGHSDPAGGAGAESF
ncbi:hypothetical protein FACS1894198_2150 [Clostridia bacterium]|nr:hypothetical protein FACS1894198_2150 [Clostridia bacterium]